MFNGAIVDLAKKPYIPQKNLLFEFVANVLRDVTGIVIFDLRGHGGQKYHEGVDLLKRVFNESFSAP